MQWDLEIEPGKWAHLTRSMFSMTDRVEGSCSCEAPLSIYHPLPTRYAWEVAHDEVVLVGTTDYMLKVYGDTIGNVLVQEAIRTAHSWMGAPLHSGSPVV